MTAIKFQLPSETMTRCTIGKHQFSKQQASDDEPWCVTLKPDEAEKLFRKFELSLKTGSRIFSEHRPTDHKYYIHTVEFGRVYLQHHLTMWVQKEMIPLLEKQANKAVCEIWDLCREDLQTIDDDYDLLADQYGRRNKKRLKDRHNLLLQQIAAGGTMDFFTRAKLWFVANTFEMPLHIETALDWLRGYTIKEMRNNDNHFKLKVGQHFYQRIIEKLEAYVKQESVMTISREHEAYNIIESVLQSFELAYTEIEQLAQTTQTSAQSKEWENTCDRFLTMLKPVELDMNNFRAVHLKNWPLKSTQILRETNVMETISDDERMFYKGTLDGSIPVYIRQLSTEYDFLAVHDELKNIDLTANHQHFLRCYGAYLEDSNLFIVTEPVCLTLEHSIKIQTPLDPMQLSIELAQTLRYLHRHKIIHGSVNKQSILLTQDLHLKLNIIANQKEKKDNVTYMDDIYSFGLVLDRLFHVTLDVNDVQLLSLTDGDSVSAHIMPHVNSTIQDLFKVCCSIDVQQRPDFNVIMAILEIEKLRNSHNLPLLLPQQKVNDSKYLRLQSIDGGGSRGVVAAKIIEILEAKLGAMWTLFDLAGGSSVGGLLVLSSIQRRTSGNEMTNLYAQITSSIFPYSRQLPTTEYSHEPLEQLLKDHFNDINLQHQTHTTTPKVFVVTKRDTDTQPYLLRNYEFTTHNELIHPGCSGWLCTEAARATTAAPTYFKPFQKDNHIYTDGGVGFNNPVQIVFEEGLALGYERCLSEGLTQPHESTSLYRFPIAYIVSIGTGVMPLLSNILLTTTNSWGISRVKKAADLLIEQATESENSHRSMLLACSRYKIPYFRFNPILNDRIRMDTSDADTLNELIRLTTEYMQQPDIQAEIAKLQVLVQLKLNPQMITTL